MTFRMEATKRGFYLFQRYRSELITKCYCTTLRRRHSTLRYKGIEKCESESVKQCTPLRLNACKPISKECVSLSSRINRRFSTKDRRLPIIYLFTKEGCTLCDEAKLSLTPYNHRFILEEVDITLPENEPWYDLYKYEIPVFHMFEEFLFKHRVDFDVLEKALKGHEDTV